MRDAGLYTLDEFINGQFFFPADPNTPQPNMRNVHRKVINFGALPNAVIKSVAHGIPVNANFTFTRIYGCATDPNTTFIPIPYAATNAVNNNISLFVDPVNVNVATAIDYSDFTICYIILEWLTD
jgi:hypothetical protein